MTVTIVPALAIWGDAAPDTTNPNCDTLPRKPRQVGVKILHYNIALTNITNLNKPLKLSTLGKFVGRNIGDIVT